MGNETSSEKKSDDDDFCGVLSAGLVVVGIFLWFVSFPFIAAAQAVLLIMNDASPSLLAERMNYFYDYSYESSTLTPEELSDCVGATCDAIVILSIWTASGGLFIFIPVSLAIVIASLNRFFWDSLVFWSLLGVIAFWGYSIYMFRGVMDRHELSACMFVSRAAFASGLLYGLGSPFVCWFFNLIMPSENEDPPDQQGAAFGFENPHKRRPQLNEYEPEDGPEYEANGQETTEPEDGPEYEANGQETTNATMTINPATVVPEPLRINGDEVIKRYNGTRCIIS